MITVLLISSEKSALSGLESYMKRCDNFQILTAKSSQEAFQMIPGKTVDLVVADENLKDMTGLEFIQKLVKVNPMINSAVVSSLSSKDFHQISEGLGVLMQLPVLPNEKHAETLINHLKKITNLSSG